MPYRDSTIIIRTLLVACMLVAASADARAQARDVRLPLTLTSVIERAQKTHPQIGVAEARESAAEAGLGQTKSQWWPHLKGQATLLQYDKAMIVGPIHGFGQGQISQIEFEKLLLQGNVSLAWTLYDGGARTSEIRSAQAEVEGAAAGLAASRQRLTVMVTRAYLQVLTAHGILEAQEQQLASFRDERERVQQLRSEGQAAEVELLRVDAVLAEAEAGRVADAAGLNLAERELARLIDVPVSNTRFANLTPVRLAPESALENRDAMIERMESLSPELERASQDVAAAEANHRAAEAAWIPRLDVQGAYQAYSSEAGNLTDLWSVGGVLSWPIFTGGQRSNAVARASAGARAAGEEMRMTRLRLLDDFDRAMNTAEETTALVVALDQAVHHSTEVVRVERLLLEVGSGTQTDYLRAEANLSRSRSSLVKARNAEIAARVDLASVIGELTPEWLTRNLESEER